MNTIQHGFTQFTFWKAVAQYDYVCFYKCWGSNHLLSDLVSTVTLSDDITLVKYFNVEFLVTNNIDSLMVLKLLGLEIFDFKFIVEFKFNRSVELNKNGWKYVDPFDIFSFSYVGSSLMRLA